MRDLVENRTAIKEEMKVGMVWKYAGQEFLDALTKLAVQMNDQGNKVSDVKSGPYAISIAKGILKGIRVPEIYFAGKVFTLSTQVNYLCNTYASSD